jgi:DNA topoisomerase VI subunit B
MTAIVRTPFTTSRLLEFCTVTELTKLVGCEPVYWPVVVVKEISDNALDACEEAGIAPEIIIAISTKKGTISITDNGPGIPPDTVAHLLDYNTKTSSREAYVAPTRGAQGNALQALLAMPFALDGTKGQTVIEACGIAHHICFDIDPVRREPEIEHSKRCSLVQSGTRVTLRWPNSASSQLLHARDEIVQIVHGFAWLNPHASFTLQWDGKRVLAMPATKPSWCKWRPSDHAPAVWYGTESFSRLIAACVAHDQDHGRDRTVREFITEFRGCARTDSQKRLLDDIAGARMSLREFFEKPKQVAKLLAHMQSATKPVPAKDLGVLGKDHFITRFEGMGVEPDTFQYRRALRDVDGVPYAIEAAFGYCPDNTTHRQIVGVNWSPSLLDPFRDLGPYDSLDALLAEQRAGRDDEPIVLALHVASPCIAYTDKAKSALVLPDEMAFELGEAAKGVTKTWARVRKAEERDATARARRRERLLRARKETVKDVAYEVMEKAYRHASDNGELPAEARQIMYAARPEIQERTERQLSDTYFTQTLLPDFMAENPERTADWDVVYDDRGHFTEPHTGHMIGLGTLSVRDYLGGVHDLKMQEAGFASARIVTRGPHGSYGALFYCEKEGFDPLFERVQLAKRFDTGTMSSKGMSVVAARKLADEICHAYQIPLLVLHDFDKAGFSIVAGFKRQASRRYTFENKIKVIDLGLRLSDVRGLQSERVSDKGSEATRRANLRRNGATEEEIEFLLHRRVELNAMTSRQLVAFVERKLQEHGIGKVVPKSAKLVDAYRLFARGREAEHIISRELKKLNGGSEVKVPRDLQVKVRTYLKKHPTMRWDEAVGAIVAAALP